MEQGRNTMIVKLKKILLEQGIDVGDNFASKVSKLSTSQLAIEISLAQAGI